MKIKDVLKPFVEKTKKFIRNNGEKEHDPLEDDDIGKFYIQICEDGSYYQVHMDDSYWYEEDDGTIVFRVNDSWSPEEKEIQEIHERIQNFAKRDLYSANCEEVKYLYRRLRELENRPEPEEDDYYEPQFIGGSDVPINGYYE